MDVSRTSIHTYLQFCNARKDAVTREGRNKILYIYEQEHLFINELISFIREKVLLQYLPGIIKLVQTRLASSTTKSPAT